MKILCIVEIPKGSRNKYEWDPDHQLMLLDRFLSASVVFPVDYGFIPDTLDQEGEDPLDVLIAVSEPTFSGCGIVAKPVAVLWLDDQGQREPKLICVPYEDPNWQDVTDVGDLGEQFREEVTHFFLAYKRREGHEVSDGGWGGCEEAERVIAEGRHRAEKTGTI